MEENEKWFYEVGFWDGKGYPRVTGQDGKVLKFSDPNDLERITQLHNNLGIIKSIYLYNGTDNETALKRGDFIIDLDSPDDPEKAREEALQAVEALSSAFNLFYGNIKIHFSGSKGFHVTIPFEAFSTPPLVNLHEIYKRIAAELKDRLKMQDIDFSLYDRSRHIRVENSIHPISKLYKIPLSFEELKNLSLDEIKELAKQPRIIDFIPITGEITKAKELFEKFQKLAEGKLKRSGKISFSLKEMPQYIREIMKGVPSGGRHKAALTLAFYYHRLGFPKVKALDMVKAWNGANPHGANPEEEIAGCVEYAYKFEVEGIEEKTPTKKGSFFEIDGQLFQQVKNGEGKSQFCVFDGKTFNYVDQYQASDGTLYLPLDCMEVDLDFVKLAGKAEEYGTDAELKREIFEFIHKYVDVSDLFKFLGTNFIIFSYLSDRSTVTPYLRAIGDVGTGKSRCTKVIGELCYNSIRVSGAATVSPIYRIIPKWHGTLIFEESDWNGSDQTNELIKIINQGFEIGNPVLRSSVDDPNDIEFHDAYCPKIFAARQQFDDTATESRCLTEIMKETTREDIPVILPPEFYNQAQTIRNKLICYRLRHYQTFEVKEAPKIEVEHRLLQLAAPMLPLFTEVEKGAFFDFLKKYQLQLRETRASSWAGQCIQKLLDLLDDAKRNAPKDDEQTTLGDGPQIRGITHKMIADEFGEKTRQVTKEFVALGFKTEPRMVHITDEDKKTGKTKTKLTSIRAITCKPEVWYNSLKRYTTLDPKTPRHSLLIPKDDEIEQQNKNTFTPPLGNVFSVFERIQTPEKTDPNTSEYNEYAKGEVAKPDYNLILNEESPTPKPEVGSSASALDREKDPQAQPANGSLGS